MREKDFPVFRQLLAEVFQKAFAEPITGLSFSKAQFLSYDIYEVTGEMISYKSLHNYVKSLLENKPERVNPTDSTLGILAGYVNPDIGTLTFAWYQYKKRMILVAES